MGGGSTAFAQFAKKSAIPADAPCLPRPSQRYNDDVVIERYPSAPSAFADRRCEGIHETPGGCTARDDRARRASGEAYRLGGGGTAPRRPNGGWPPGRMPSSRRCGVLRRTSGGSTQHDGVHGETKGRAGQISSSCDTPICRKAENGAKQIRSPAQLGASRWLTQFASGFPITDHPSESGSTITQSRGARFRGDGASPIGWVAPSRMIS